MHMSKISIIVPTYNERANIEALCSGIQSYLAENWDYEIIVVDDNSPDGTYDVVVELGLNDDRIKLIKRSGKLGLGSAVKAGFELASGDYWIMMDADLSHRPMDLPGLIQGLSDADIVVGSRYVDGGSVVNWPFWRKVVSIGASTVGRMIIGLSVKDLTSGFGAFRKDSMEKILVDLNPKGFKLLMEILVKSSGARIKEVPITFVDRTRGKSKASFWEAMLFLRLCFSLRNWKSPREAE